MMLRSHRLVFIASLIVMFGVAGPPRVAGPFAASAELPDRLSDQDFWQLSADLSEPNGQFQSDNLLSNEMVFPRIVPELISAVKPGGVYLGVGPEQNFTYIAAIKPRMAFITDIRRGNLELQLMYKALFEMSADRAEFISRLFCKPKPQALASSLTARDLMNAFWDVPTSDETGFAANLKAIDDDLTKTHKLALSAEDLEGIAGVYRAFYWYGPAMNYSASVALTNTQNRGVTYADLVSQADQSGQGLSYLASEETFGVMKELERKNLLVPVVGNFSGPKALRAVGAYIRAHQATVSAFYLSNVEMYLRRAGTWGDFCGNVATMPLDEHSVFIRPNPSGMITVVRSNGGTVGTTGNAYAFNFPVGQNSTATNGLVPIEPEVKNCSGGVAR